MNREGRVISASPCCDFITAHDGFTLRDLVSYEGKHNEASTGQWRRIDRESEHRWRRARHSDGSLAGGGRGAGRCDGGAEARVAVLHCLPHRRRAGRVGSDAPPPFRVIAEDPDQGWEGDPVLRPHLQERGDAAAGRGAAAGRVVWSARVGQRGSAN